jgi:hypothetical protein
MSNNGHSDTIQLMIPHRNTRYRVLFRKANTGGKWHGRRYFYKSVKQTDRRKTELIDQGFEVKFDRISAWVTPK